MLRIHHVHDPRSSPSRRTNQTPREEIHPLQARMYTRAETSRNHLVEYGYFVA